MNTTSLHKFTNLLANVADMLANCFSCDGPYRDKVQANTCVSLNVAASLLNQSILKYEEKVAKHSSEINQGDKLKVKMLMRKLVYFDFW